MLLHRIGLRPDPTLRGRLHRAIREELHEHRQDVTTYLANLAGGGEALQGLLNRVTVQETAFFRHPEQFEVLAREVLPTLPRPVRIWSAGCANGQEAFSLAMLLEEQGIDGCVIGTDISTAALHRTAAGRYLTRELSGLSPRRIARHLSPTGGRLADQCRDPRPGKRTASQSARSAAARGSILPGHLLPQRADLPVAGIRADISRIGSPTRFPHRPFSSSVRLKRSGRCRTGSRPSRSVTPSSIARRSLALAWSRPAPDSATPEVTQSSQPPSHRRSGCAHGPRRSSKRETRSPVPRHRPARSSAEPESATSADLLARVGQDAIAAGDFDAAVVAFRKCAYLAPHDPVAQAAPRLGAGSRRR